MLFNAAPVGDPKSKVLLTVAKSPCNGPFLMVIVHKGEDIFGEIKLPYDALILSGMPSQGLTNADDMVTLLDRAAAALPDWTRARKAIKPRPETAA